MSIWMLDSTSGALFTSPRLRGEVGLRASAIRVRGAIREFDYAETAPHPNPLPVKNGEREFLPAHAIFIA